ncbi:P-loop containing nucleoside triphosphate hydrolase protein [Gongronella butleri]|nr:P-loop containing nucleoside triphosphate hydrolase protein [Gongronella butleri]
MFPFMLSVRSRSALRLTSRLSTRCITTTRGVPRSAAVSDTLLDDEMASIVDTAPGPDNEKAVLQFVDLKNDVYAEILHPEQGRGVASTSLPALNRILKGHRRGELSIITGPTGCGKTTIMSQLSLDFCASGVPTLWGSFEILNRRLVKKMLYQFAGKDLSLCPEEIDQWGHAFQQLPMYFLKFFSSTAIHDVVRACHQAIDTYDVQHIILDNLQFMLSQQGKSSLDKWELQDRAIHELRRLATERDVHISLVVHPRKDMGDQLDINSIFGSAKVSQEADNVIILQREGLGGQPYLDVKKNRYDGTTGIIPYVFMQDSLKIRSCTEEELHAVKQKHRSSSAPRTSWSSSRGSTSRISESSQSLTEVVRTSATFQRDS